jgi:hypothetical protein
MNIPLINSNSKQDINTSLIAIRNAINELARVKESESVEDLQRQINIINQQIANFNSEFSAINTHLNTIDTNILNLQPVDTVASGNLHSVTSNGVYNAFLNPSLLKFGTFGLLGGSNEYPHDTPIGADDLVTGLAHKGGMCSGSTELSINQLGVDCVGNFNWVNFIYIPHRNGIQQGDNPDYGVCFIIPMTNEYLDTFYIVHRIGGRNRTAIRYEPNITKTVHVTITTDGNGNGFTGYTTSSDYMPIAFKPIGTSNYPTIITCDNSGNYWLKPFDWGNFVIKPNFTLEGDLVLQRQK